MATDTEWQAVAQILEEMTHPRYHPTVRAMRPLIERLKSNEFDDVHARMTFYGFFLSRRRTGESIVVSWEDDTGYSAQIARPDPEVYRDRVYTRDLDQLVDILRTYVQQT